MGDVGIDTSPDALEVAALELFRAPPTPEICAPIILLLRTVAAEKRAALQSRAQGEAVYQFRTVHFGVPHGWLNITPLHYKRINQIIDMDDDSEDGVKFETRSIQNAQPAAVITDAVRALPKKWRDRARAEDEDGELYETEDSVIRLHQCADELEDALAVSAERISLIKAEEKEDGKRG